MTSKHFAIIGAGIVGICSGLNLINRGHKVTFIDPRGFSGGCSKGNAGHFATEQVFPLADKSLLWQLPKMLMDPLGPVSFSPSYFPKALPWFMKFMANMSSSAIKKNTKALQALNENAIEEYKPLVASAKAEHLFTLKGSLLAYETQDKAVVEKDYLKYKNAGIAVEIIDKKQVQKLEPQLSDAINYALYFTDVGHTADPYELGQALASHAMALGACLIEEEVHEIEENGSIEIETDAGKYAFDSVLIATGAWSKPLFKKLGYKLPIEVERGYHLMMPEFAALNRPVASAERKFIMTPMASGLRLAGTVEFAGLKKAPNYKRADIMHSHAKEMLREIPSYSPDKATEEQRWMGFRPSLPDSLPVIDKSPKHENVYFAVGHQHLGLCLGAITGKLVGQMVESEETDIDLSPFSISRFN